MSVNTSVTHRHPYHLVDPSPWPLLTAFSALSLTTGGVLYMHSYSGGGYLLAGGLISVIAVASAWWRDIVREGTFEGHHTLQVQAGLRSGMILFIVSEVMFFFAFFWAFFHSSLSPVFNIGGVWPPQFITPLNPWDIPLLNTLLLLSSGATVTWAHHALVGGNRSQGLKSLVATVILAAIFTALQAYEYLNAPFGIADSVYGSTFYMATGFHGFHVIIGTIFLSVCLGRMFNGHFSRQHHFGFEAAAWYWHFVDVVWIFLFITIYWWGN